MIRAVEPPRFEDIQAAGERLKGSVLRTPLVRLDLEDAPAEIHLKLENLQPIGSFKLRGAGNAMRSVGRDALRDGVYTASAGNMAQGVAWTAREMGVPCTVVVPETAPKTKLDAIGRLGAAIVSVPFDVWWRVIEEHHHPGIKGRFIHPVSDPAVIAGNGTVGLEILDQLPDADAILVPYGGGGLISGIAAAARVRAPRVRVYACEVETAAPLHASLQAGSPRSIDRRPSFVDGIGGRSVLPEMWPLVRDLAGRSLVVTLEEVACAIRLLAERARVIAEGAGAVPVAAALGGGAEWSALGSHRPKVVCVVSGGNIDPHTFARIL
ncbi:MAG: threonine/serine dehydratase, partial [Candidatus Latescibacteria bacterium]|nr:threonine/serine dehydratase [Candidatus Latescibacterota bacterium]